MTELVCLPTLMVAICAESGSDLFVLEKGHRPRKRETLLFQPAEQHDVLGPSGRVPHQPHQKGARRVVPHTGRRDGGDVLLQHHYQRDDMGQAESLGITHFLFVCLIRWHPL